MTLGGIQGGSNNLPNSKDVWIAIAEYIAGQEVYIDSLRAGGNEGGLGRLTKGPNLENDAELESNPAACGASQTWNFFAKDRLPDHIKETFTSFTDFVSVFYKWLECNQSLTVLDTMKDIDEAADVFIQLYKNVYAKGFPDKTFAPLRPGEPSEPVINFIEPSLSPIQVRNFLRYVQDFYQLKSIEEAYKWFFSSMYASEVEISYPKIYVHKLSEGAYMGASAGITLDPCYYWGDHYTLTPKWSRDEDLPTNQRYPQCVDFENEDDPFGNCVPLPFPEYGPTGPCYYNSSNQLCWGHGGSFDVEGNQLYPPCDACGAQIFGTGQTEEDLVGINPGGDGEPIGVDSSTLCLGCAPGHPCGIYYENDFGLLSGFARIHDNKIWQDYSYLLDSQIPWDSYKDWVKSILHPAGMYFVGNYTVTDTFPQPGTTGEIFPVETPIIGHYAPYRFNTSENLRNNVLGTDLYPCGWNPYAIAQGVSYSSQHILDSGGLWYKYELGTTAHQPAELPLGICGGTGGLAAAQYGVNFFRVFHHPNSWSTTVPPNSLFKDVSLGSFIFLTAIDSNSGTPNNPAGGTAGCGF